MIEELQAFRQQYSAYNDVDDLTLVNSLAQKFPQYSDLVGKVKQEKITEISGQPELAVSHVPFTQPPKETLTQKLQRMGQEAYKKISEYAEKETGPGETIRSIGTVYGPVEAAANLVSQLYGVPAIGIAEIIKSAGGPEWLPKKVGEATIYQPKTEAGKQLTEASAYPWAKIGQMSEAIADYIGKQTRSPLAATAVGTIAEALGIVLTGKGISKALPIKGKETKAEVPKGKGPVKISPEGEPVYPPGMKPVIEELPKEIKAPKPEMALEKPRLAEIREPSVSIEQLEKNPFLADYVIKRPEIHEANVLGRAKEISKTGKVTVETIKEMEKDIPRFVTRVEEKGIEISGVEKPHGLYTGIQHPAQAELKGAKKTFETSPEANILKVDTSGFVRTPERGLGGESAGMATLKKLLPEKEYNELINLKKSDLIPILREKYPNIEWNKYFDTQEMLEGYAGLLARKKGYDAIWGYDKESPEFSEYVGLTKRAFKETTSLESLEAQVKGGPAGPLPKYAEGSSINLERLNTTEDVKHFVNGITKSIEEKIGKKRISWDETRTKAEELGWDVSALKKAWNKKGSFSAAEIDAARQTNLNAISELHEMLRTLPAERTGYTPAQRAKLLDALDSVRVTSQASSEAGRALNIHKKILSKDPAFKEASEINRVLKALSGKGVKRTDAIIDALKQINFDNPAEVNRFIYNVTKNKWQKLSDGAFELWINGLLSNPLTHIRNTTSNALTMAFQYPERLLGAGIEAGRALVTKTPRERFAKETIQDVFSFTKGLQDGTKWFLDAMAKGEPVSKLETGVTHVSAFPRAEKFMPGRALAAEDAFFKGFIEHQEMNRLAMRKALREGLKGETQKQRVIDLLKNPTEEMLEQAAIKGKYLTYQKDLGKIGNLVLEARKKVPGLKYFVPFVRTPANIAKFALERTPLNIPRIAYKAAKGELKRGEFSDEAAKALVGSLLGGTTYLFAKQGMITGGGPKNKGERDELYRIGWLPYAVKIGGKYYSFAQLEPLGSILGMAADMYEIKEQITKDEESDLFKIGAAIGSAIQKNISSKTFTHAFAMISDFLSDPGRYGEKVIYNLLGSAIPSVSAGIARSVDPELRDAKTIVDTIKSRIPEVSKTVGPKLDIWGESIERPGTPISRFISPVQVSKEKGTPIDYELTRLKLNIGMPSKKIGNAELTEEEYTDFLKIAGQKNKQVLNSFIKKESYKKLSDENKERAIKSTVSGIRQWAKVKTLNKMTPERRKELFKKKEGTK